MTEKPEQLEIIVGTLNGAFEDQTGSHGQTFRPFQIQADGFDQAVTFFGILLWNAEDDEREFITHVERGEEPEPLDKFLADQAAKILDDIKNVKF